MGLFDVFKKRKNDNLSETEQEYNRLKAQLEEAERERIASQRRYQDTVRQVEQEIKRNEVKNQQVRDSFSDIAAMIEELDTTPARMSINAVVSREAGRIMQDSQIASKQRIFDNKFGEAFTHVQHFANLTKMGLKSKYKGLEASVASCSVHDENFDVENILFPFLVEKCNLGIASINEQRELSSFFIKCGKDSQTFGKGVVSALNCIFYSSEISTEQYNMIANAILEYMSNNLEQQNTESMEPGRRR